MSESNYHKDNTLRTVWLTMNVPGRQAETIPDLEAALREFALDWIQEADKNTQAFGPTNNYAFSTGVVEANKLRIFIQER